MIPETIEETTDGGLPCTPCSRSFRAGDDVHHLPSGENWKLATDEENGRVSPCGWPPTLAEAKDCVLQFAADDNERMEMLKTWAAEGRGYEHERDHRTRTARHHTTCRRKRLLTNNKNMTTLEQQLEDAGYDASELLCMDGYNDCIVGVVNRIGQPPIICYDTTKVIASLVNDGMTEEEAEEYFNFNQLGAWIGENTPCFLTPLTLEQPLQ